MVLVIALAGVAGYFLTMGKTSPQGSENRPEENDIGIGIGQIAPDFTLTDIDGHPFSLSDHRGKIVIIDFHGHMVRPLRCADGPSQGSLWQLR